MKSFAATRVRNEKTSKRVAAIASRMKRKIDAVLKNEWVEKQDPVCLGGSREKIGTVEELQSVLQSAITQSPDKPKDFKIKLRRVGK